MAVALDCINVPAALRGSRYVAFHVWLLGQASLMCHILLDRADNLVSVLLAIGSPALAGYSLAITRLNSRWLSRQFMYLHFPNRLNIPLSISALQHIPFRIDSSGSLLPSLIVLPQNDRYWKLLSVAARRTRQWSIPVAMNIIWVLVAFLFTIVDSFVDFDTFLTVPGDAGYSIAAVWTYLLPVVVGWLHVGSQLEADYLRDALNDAHEIAYVATASEPVLASRVTGPSTRAIEPSTRLIDHVNADEKKTAPIFNYARVFIWSQNAECVLRPYERAATKAGRGLTVRGGTRVSDNDAITPQDRTGNEMDVIKYCMEEEEYVVEPSLRSSSLAAQYPPPFSPYSAFSVRSASNSLTKYDEEATEEPLKPVFATEVFYRVVFAAVFALGLQWGTTGAAVLIHIFTPPKGVGCRALTFSLYGAAGTVSFCLLLCSSILAHLVRRQSIREKRSGLKQFIGCITTLMRWLGKTIAIVNGFGIVIACGMQFGGVYDNCFCSSTILGSNQDGLVKFVEDNIKGSEVYGYWIGGTVMAFAVSGLYSFAIYVATPMG